MTYQINTVQKPNINRFHNAFKGASIDTNKLYKLVGINSELMEAEGTSLPMPKYFELQEVAAKLSEKRFLSTELSLTTNNKNFGMLEYLLMNAPDFEQGLKLLSRYLILVSPGAVSSLIETEDGLVLTYKNIGLAPEVCCQDVEGTIAQFVVLVRTAVKNNQWFPERVFFEHKAPDKSELINYPLESELQFDCLYNGILFPREFLRLPIDNNDPKLLALLESQVKMTTTSNSSIALIESINLVISAKLGQQPVTADNVAKELGMSRRSLNRYLEDYGTSFKTIKESLILEIAKQKLTNSSISITNLAQELGYSDSSAFNRLFKRLTGYRPLEYRKVKV